MPKFWLGGNIGQSSIHDLISSPVLQWRRQNFGSGTHSAKMRSSKTFEKIFKIYKKICTKILKILQILLKIKNLIEFKKIMKILKQFNKILKEILRNFQCFMRTRRTF